MKNEFPKYYLDKKIGLYHKLEAVDSVNIEKEKIYYRGIIMQHFGNKCNICEDCIFTHSSCDDWEEITEKEFNDAYKSVKKALEPKYYFNIYNGNWFYKKDSKTCGCETIYNGTIIDTFATRIIGNAELGEEELNANYWHVYAKSDYEKALNKVLNKIK